MRRLAVAFVVGSALTFVMLPVPAVAGGGGKSCSPLAATERPAGLTVLVRDSCFTPKRLAVTTGQAVTWRPSGTYFHPHTVTASGGLFDSKDLAGLFTVRFNQPGVYAYTCIYHSGMEGSVEVAGPAVPDATAAATVLSETDPSEDPQAMLADAENRLARAIASLRNETADVQPEPGSMTISGPAVGLAAISALMVGAVLLVRRRGPA